MKKSTSYQISLCIFLVWLYVFYNMDNNTVTIDGVIASILFTFLSWVFIWVIIGIDRRIENGVDIFATLESDPKKVKERMLFVMRYGHNNGLNGAIEEFNDIFRNYPQWHFQNWVVFRAWYKDMIDRNLRYPDISHLTKSNGEPYIKEEDPLYDPEAPAWEQFDRHHYYDINDEEDESYDEDEEADEDEYDEDVNDDGHIEDDEDEDDVEYNEVDGEQEVDVRVKSKSFSFVANTGASSNFKRMRWFLCYIT